MEDSLGMRRRWREGPEGAPGEENGRGWSQGGGRENEEGKIQGSLAATRPWKVLQVLHGF